MTVELAIEVRTLRAGEEEELLRLLDAWPFRDGRRGREFFRRYLTLDPAYRPDNVWVAEQRDELVGCAQIFPRLLRLAGERVPSGGIGSVFTRPDHRGRGVASGILRRAARAMQERGMELSLLHGNLHEWYRSLGWRPWGGEPHQMTLGDRRAGLIGSLDVVRFDADEHRSLAAALAELYSRDRHGTVWRDAEGWSASLALAGDPLEEFLLAGRPDDPEPTVFLRGAYLSGAWRMLEWARRPDRARELARLMVSTQSALGLERVFLPPLQDPELGLELERFGARLAAAPAPPGEQAPVWMLRCLAPEALARRLRLERAPRDGWQLLEEVLPPASFHFWPADRF